MPISEGGTSLPVDNNGLADFGIYDGTNFWLPRSPGADALGPTGIQMVAPMRWNGATWDRPYQNYGFQVLASAARTAGASSALFINQDARGLMLSLFCTAKAGTTTVLLTINNSSLYNFALNTAFAVPVSGIITCYLYPQTLTLPTNAAGGGSAGNQTTQTTVNIVGGWNIATTHSDGSSITYAVYGTWLF